MILLLEVPEQTHVAFDHQSFVVGPKFKGVKMLPPGTHMVSYNAASHTGDFAPTSSFFVHLAPSQVYVRKWSIEQELLFEVPADEAEPFQAGARRYDFDQNLAPYNLHAYQHWQSLSSCISQGVISRLSPLPSGNISITAEADPAHLEPVTPAEKKLYAQLQQGKTAAESTGSTALRVDGEQQSEATPSDRQQDTSDLQTSDLRPQEGVGRCYYTRLPRLVKVPGMNPQQLTALNLDKTGLLSNILQKHFGDKPGDLLGELQFSFLAFLMGQSLEGFAQWKAIIHLLLGCQDGPLQTHIHFFIRFLQCLHNQLQHSLVQEPISPRDSEPSPDAPFGIPIIEELLADSFLQQLFAQFFNMLHEEAATVNAKLLAASKQVQQLLQEKLGWEFDFQDVGLDEEEDEYAPTVVQLDGVQL
ncbi:TPA: hypothetical protein ACH3X2_010623 [Trebouxia sp. C0005]